MRSRRSGVMLSTIHADPKPGAYQPEPRDGDRPPLSRCCAKCRRGVPGFGDLPCGYNLLCPNKCHEKTGETR